MYIVQSDLEAVIPEDEFVQLTDRVNVPPTIPDSTIINAAIDAAEGRFHMFMARRYLLPLDTTDSILLQFIKRPLVDYAWEALHPRADMVPKELSTLTAAHDTVFGQIRDGKADLPATSPPAAASTESKILGFIPPRCFTGLP